MTKQKTPHTDTQQDVSPEQTDMESDLTLANDEAYDRMDGAETGMNRSPRIVEAVEGSGTHQTLVPETEAHEGALETRTPKRPVQGITSRSAEEESARQEKVVNDRPDARAGVNHSK